MEAEYICALPPGHALSARPEITPADLEGQTFIGPMHEADALWFGVDRMLEEQGIVVRRTLETQQSFTGYAFVAAGLGLMIAEPFSAPTFARLGVGIRRFRPALSVGFAMLEPDLGPTPPQVELFRRRVFEATAARLAEVEGLAGR